MKNDFKRKSKPKLNTTNLPIFSSFFFLLYVFFYNNQKVFNFNTKNIYNFFDRYTTNSYIPLFLKSFSCFKISNICIQ